MRSLPAYGIVKNGLVLVGDQCLTFESKNAYPEGTQVKVWCDRFFMCQSLDEIEQERQAWQRKQQEREQLKQAQEAQQRKEIQAFNAALNIPVRWFPEIKHRLGGLMENSAGNGTCKNSVVHIYLLEGLHDGRLHRNARDFLCTQPEGHHFSELISLESEPWNFENLQVTCQQCLKIAKRWQQNNPLAADRKGRAKKLVAEPQGLFAPALPGC